MNAGVKEQNGAGQIGSATHCVSGCVPLHRKNVVKKLEAIRRERGGGGRGGGGRRGGGDDAKEDEENWDEIKDK